MSVSNAKNMPGEVKVEVDFPHLPNSFDVCQWVGVNLKHTLIDSDFDDDNDDDDYYGFKDDYDYEGFDDDNDDEDCDGFFNLKDDDDYDGVHDDDD